MKRIFLSFILIAAAAIEAAAEYVETALLDSIGIPVVYIETVDGEEPACDYVLPPEGSVGAGIINATKVPGRIVMKLRGNVLYDSGEYEKGTSGMTVKIRGNTSAYGVKKPYKIKLQKKADMLCRGNDDLYKDKNWVLLTSAWCLNTRIGLEISRVMGLQWTPSYRYVNLVMNGDYRGIYNLIESVERNENCRIDVDAEQGYIVEMDAYWWTEDVYFDTYYTDAEKRYTFKYPDPDDITEAQIENICEYIKKMELAIDNGTYPDYLDVRSFAVWVLSHDILGTSDSGGANIYMTRKDDASKMLMGNLWDFDTIGYDAEDWGRIHYSDFFYFKKLFANSNREFTRTYKEVWNEIKDIVFDDVTAYMDSLVQSSEAVEIDKSLVLDAKRWDDVNKTVSEQTTRSREFFSVHKPWLENAISQLDADNAISIVSMSTPTDKTAYNLAGQCVTDGYKGMIIRNGRKFFNK
ncbi:MAG: CotH kinase family protein [Prevotella sp.]